MKKIFLIGLINLIAFGGLAQLDRTKAPDPQPNPEIKINIPDAVTLPNGLKLIVVENHKLPKVSFQLYIDYPVYNEGDKAGISQLFSELLACGTTSLTKDDFDQQIDYIGASIATTPRGFFASSLKKHTPQLLTLLSDMIMNPAFPEADFERLKNQTLSNLASIASDPNSISSIVSGVVNYGASHPYGEVMTEETVGNISVDDIKAFYNKFFIPNYAYLVIVGDVNFEEANKYANDYFAKWQKGESLKTPVYSIDAKKGNNLYFVDKPGAVQSVINVTHTVKLNPGHPDEIAVSVMNAILGGGSFSARLMANLREDKAYTYGCYSSIQSDQIIGTFSAGGSFRNEVTDSALTQIIYEIERMINNPVDEKELTLIKSSMTGAFARSLERPETVARFALNTIRYNLPKDYYQNYLMNLEKVTVADVNRVAKQYLTTAFLNIVVVGNQEIAEKLKSFDADNAVHYKDFYGNDKAQLKTVGEGVTAESIFKNYVFKTFMVTNETELMAKLKKIGFIQTTYAAEVAEMGGTITIITYKGKPNKSASIFKASGAMGNMVLHKDWFNGAVGGEFNMGEGKKEYKDDELTNKMKPSFPMSQWYYSTDEDYKIELLGIEEISAVEYYKIKISKTGEEDFGFEYYNVSTGLLEIEESFAKNPETGEMNSSKVTYKDYKDTGKGLFYPYKYELNTQGMVIPLELKEIIVSKKPKSNAFIGEFEN